jgi:hypothetical protein
MMRVTLVLGRDGMGEADEEDFDTWVAYVCDRIDERAGVVVDVDVRAPRDVQSDEIRGGTDEQRTAVAEAKAALWDDWCSEGAARAPDAVSVLSEPAPGAVWVHGVTGQDVEERTLPAGTLVRRVETDVELVGGEECRVSRFQASEDGEHWYDYRYYDVLALEPS